MTLIENQIRLNVRYVMVVIAETSEFELLSMRRLPFKPVIKPYPVPNNLINFALF